MKTELSKIAEIRSGYPFRSRIKEAEDGDVLAVQMKNIDEIAGVNWGEESEFSSKSVPVIRTHLPGRKPPDWLMEGDVLFAARGDRNVAICLKNVPGETVCSPHFFQLRIIDDGVLPEFLAWQINQRPAQNYLEQSSGGTLIRNIRRGVLESLPIAIPPINQQQSIIGLDNATKKEQANLEARIRNSRDLLNAIAYDLAKTQI